MADTEDYEYEDETIIEEELYDEVSLLSTVWEESSKDLSVSTSRATESLSKLSLATRQKQHQSNHQIGSGSTNPSANPSPTIDQSKSSAILRKIPRRKRNTEQYFKDGPNGGEMYNSKSPMAFSAVNPKKSSNNDILTPCNSANNNNKWNASPCADTKHNRISLGTFLESSTSTNVMRSKDDHMIPTPKSSSFVRSRTVPLIDTPQHWNDEPSKQPSNTSHIFPESSVSSIPVGKIESQPLAGSSSTETSTPPRRRQPRRMSLDSFLSDYQPSSSGSKKKFDWHEIDPNHNNQACQQQAPQTTNTNESSNKNDNSNVSNTEAVTKSVALTTLVSLLTGEEVVVPEEDDEYTYVSYLSDGTMSFVSNNRSVVGEEQQSVRSRTSATATSVGVGGEQTDNASNGSMHSSSKPSLRRVSSWESQSIALSLDAIAEGEDFE